MAPKKKDKVVSNREYKEIIARELTSLADILTNNFYDFCHDLSPLHRAADECRQGDDNVWGYSLERLIFRLDVEKLRHTLPRKVSEISLILNIDLLAICMVEEGIHDPFQRFQFDTLLDGRRDEDGMNLLCSWHLDRDDPGEGDGQQEFIHPCYHFQYGGKHMRGQNLDYGNALILEPPRIAHPPLDAILGIDFILTNYFSSSYTAFREEQQYKDLLESAQARIWKPYAQALAAQWTMQPNNASWQATKIWPQLADRRR